MSSSGRVNGLQLSEDEWAVYDLLDGAWEFVGTFSAPDDPDGAARNICASKWTSGTHRLLAVNAVEAREFAVSLECQEVNPNGGD